MQFAIRLFVDECPEGAAEQIETIFERTVKDLDPLGDVSPVLTWGDVEVIREDGALSIEKCGHIYTVYDRLRTVCETVFAEVAELVYENRLERSF